MKLFKALKQPDNKSCQHTVLAMIVGESVDYVKEWFDWDLPLGSDDAILFLAHHGIYLATFLKAKNDHIVISDIEDITFTIPMKGRPAMLAVKSERYEGKLHAVLWTGKEVLDPNPNVKESRTLDSYKIVEIWPMIMTEERHESL